MAKKKQDPSEVLESLKESVPKDRNLDEFLPQIEADLEELFQEAEELLSDVERGIDAWADNVAVVCQTQRTLSLFANDRKSRYFKLLQEKKRLEDRLSEKTPNWKGVQLYKNPPNSPEWEALSAVTAKIGEIRNAVGVSYAKRFNTDVDTAFERKRQDDESWSSFNPNDKE
jgi:chromosome segregation ATPase